MFLDSESLLDPLVCDVGLAARVHVSIVEVAAWGHSRVNIRSSVRCQIINVKVAAGSLNFVELDGHFTARMFERVPIGGVQVRGAGHIGGVSPVRGQMEEIAICAHSRVRVLRGLLVSFGFQGRPAVCHI